MKRLFLREWHEDLPYLWGTIALIAGLLLLGDPLVFRGSLVFKHSVDCPYGILFVVEALVVWVMGLSGYSRDIAAETLPFTMSLPVRWRSLLYAKVLAGSAVCLVSGAFAGALYVCVAPSMYRPFLDATSIVVGSVTLVGSMLAAFLLGLAFSALASGTALSVAVAIAFLAAYSWLDGSFKHVFPNTSVLLMAGIVPAFIGAVKIPSLLHPRHRVRNWAGYFVVGILALGFFDHTRNTINHRVPPESFLPADCSWIESPDKQYLALWPWPYGKKYPGDLWVRDNHEHYTHVDRAQRTAVLTWSLDNSTVYYAAGTNEEVQLKAASARDGWRPRAITSLPLPVRKAGDYRAYFESIQLENNGVKWSPAGNRFAIPIGVFTTDQSSATGTVVCDLASGRAFVAHQSTEGNTNGMWWIDNSRLAVLTENSDVRVVRGVPAPQ